MSDRSPKMMSTAELNEYLDDLVKRGKEDTTEFETAYDEWEARG